MIDSFSSPQTKVFALAAVSLCLIIGGLLWFSRGDDRALPAAAPVRAKQSAASALPVATAPVPTSAASKVNPAPDKAQAATFASFHLRPFAVIKSSGANAWTAEDGRAPEVIRQLAHNELEAARMTAENALIKRRQLVYRSEPIATMVQRAWSAGQPVQSFTLPAMDGQEYSVEVTQNNVEHNQSEGSLAGHLKDRPNSVASIGFKGGYESFNILSPDDGVYIVADAREPGEVMLKEIIPGKYGASAPGHEPDYILPPK